MDPLCVLLQTIFKAGVCARGDAHKVSKDFDIEVQGIAELTDHPIVRADQALLSRSLASKLATAAPLVATQTQIHNPGKIDNVHTLDQKTSLHRQKRS